MKIRRARKWTNEQLVEAVKISSDLTEVIRKLGLRVAGGNHKSIRYWINEYKLDTSHWNTDTQLAGLRKQHKRLPENDIEIFTLNSSFSQSSIRRRAKIALEYKCQWCSVGTEYNKKPLTLQLDHINGDRTDNRKENLRWLCPNCHSQTETYVGRKAFNNGLVDTSRYCIDCKTVKLVKKTAKRCRPCADKLR
jgi:Zn finger protein HypA/HybF involved in hydrogenase expression